MQPAEQGLKLRSPFAIPPSDLETPADGCACKRRGLDFDGVDISPVARRCFRAVDEGGKIEIDGQQIRVVWHTGFAAARVHLPGLRARLLSAA